MLSPIYTKFLTEMIGNTVCLVPLKRLDHRDHSILVAIALYCIENEDDSKKIRHDLEKFGHFVCGYWDAFLLAIHKHNLEGVQDAVNPVNELLGRFKNVG